MAAVEGKTTVQMTLFVRPKSAELTRDTEIFGNMDPYVVARIGQQQQKSSVHKEGGKHPIWTSQLLFRDFNKKTKLAIDLFDENLVSDSRIGGGWIDLQRVLDDPNKIHHERLSIFYDGKICGVVMLELEYQTNAAESQDVLSQAVRQSTEIKTRKTAPEARGKNIGLETERQSIENASKGVPNTPPRQTTNTPTSMHRNSAQQILSNGSPYQQNVFQTPPPYAPLAYQQPPANPYSRQPAYSYTPQPVYQQPIYVQQQPRPYYPQQPPAQIINPERAAQDGRLFSMVGGMMMAQNGKLVLPSASQQASNQKRQPTSSDGWGWQF